MLYANLSWLIVHATMHVIIFYIGDPELFVNEL